ncbi:hypothetical protein CBR_g23284 [Chara braunii]|uniref:Uncharacterized protein n=1 Tax=Chara braunii TaxID=69332 RepID=A0A388L3S2_CHABU|nr:hypothetical protein CBR_g23284 [Chara braunii]|eukprot:GBG76954.1 hypothetical protein CBR_g23284 [Chara braunii]
MVRLPSGELAWKREGEQIRDQFVHIRYTSRLMEAVPQRRLVLDALRQVVGEKSASWLDVVVIGWRYGELLGARLCKPGKVFKKFRLDGWEADYRPDHCACGDGRQVDFLSTAAIRLLPREGYPPVITNDTGITNNGQLRLMMNARLYHIPLRALDEGFAIREIEEALDAILTTRCCDAELTMAEETQVKKLVIMEAKSRMRDYYANHMHIVKEPINGLAVRREIEWITDRFLVCPTDKAPHTPTFVCINFISRLALERLLGPDLVPVEEAPALVGTRFLQEAASFVPVAHLEDIMPLPYLMAVYKAHKEAFRWITNT